MLDDRTQNRHTQFVAAAAITVSAIAPFSFVDSTNTCSRPSDETGQPTDRAGASPQRFSKR